MPRLVSSIALLLLALPAFASPPKAIAEFVQTHCVSCHDSATKKGGLDLEAIGWGEDAAAHAKWVRAFDLVASGEMPPKKKHADAERKAFLATLGSDLAKQHALTKGTVLRRLNRTEYENTLRDLLGIRVQVRHLLPEDSLAHGFDNIGEALGLSDVQMRQYMEAAGAAIDELLTRTEKPVSIKHEYAIANRARVSKEGPTPKAVEDRNFLVKPDGTVVVFHSGRYPNIAPQKYKDADDTRGVDFRAHEEGKYRITIRGHAYQSEDPVVFGVRIGKFNVLGDFGAIARSVEFNNTPSTYEFEYPMHAGERIRLLPELNMDYALMQKKGPLEYPGPGLAIQSITVEGPLPREWPPRGQKMLIADVPTKMKRIPLRFTSINSLRHDTKNPEADAERLLKNFTSAAFRRPASDAKVAPYLSLFRTIHSRNGDFTMALRSAAVAILCSPDFLYLTEPAGKLDDFALASRLSYFLWRTMPDDELLALAAANKLGDPAILKQQTERMLKHANAARFYTDFTDGWLNLREIEFTTPDARLYPEFDESLQWSMVEETRAFLRELTESNLSPSNVVASDFAMLNGRLAEHYGLPPVAGGDIRKVTLPANSHRGGVLTQGAVMKVSANGTNTSPVVRGAYVLDRILGTPPPPPPPGVPGVEPDIRGAKTLREILDQHRKLDTCNACHAKIDPPGFALESYDVIGGWRERFRTMEKGTPGKGNRKRQVRYKEGLPVDASGKMADGSEFRDFPGFQALLLKEPTAISRCMAEKLLTFATGREPGFSDRAEIERIVTKLAADKGGMRDLLHGVIQSEYFRNK